MYVVLVDNETYSMCKTLDDAYSEVEAAQETETGRIVIVEVSRGNERLVWWE